MARLSEKQKGLKEKATQIARQLETASVRGRRLREAIRMMQQADDDLQNKRYEDAARKRRMALRQLRSTFLPVEHSTVMRRNPARELPAALRQELLQSADESYPKGYESLLESYFRALSEAEN